MTTLALDWIKRHDGAMVDTSRRFPPDLRTTHHAPRRLEILPDGRALLANLDGSPGNLLEITDRHRVLEVSRDALRLQWLAPNGTVRCVTTYTALP